METLKVDIDVLGGDATAEVHVRIKERRGFFGIAEYSLVAEVYAIHGDVSNVDRVTAMRQAMERILEKLR